MNLFGDAEGGEILEFRFSISFDILACLGYTARPERCDVAHVERPDRDSTRYGRCVPVLSIDWWRNHAT